MTKEIKGEIVETGPSPLALMNHHSQKAINEGEEYGQLEKHSDGAAGTAAEIFEVPV
jgi:hypothetical protein